MVKHKHLCRIASGLLRKAGYSVILEEFVSISSESPDILAFKNGTSVLIEAKNSRSDFKADAKKNTRRKEDLGMGNYRYYIAPKGLLKKHEIPDGWGFIEVNNEVSEFIIGKDLTWHHPEGDVHWKKSNQGEELLVTLSCIRKMPKERIKNRNYKVYVLDEGIK